MASIRRRNGRYQVRVTRCGQSVSRTFIQLDDAKRWARRSEIEADTADLPNTRKALQGVTLGQLVERYRDEISPRNKGVDMEQTVLNAFLRTQKALCQKPLSSLRLKEFATYRDQRLRTISPSSLKRQLAIIRHMFKVAKTEWGLPVSNPLDGLSLADSPRRERRLRDGELKRLLSAAADCRHGTLARIIVFAVETGMRRGEILGIRFAHIDCNEPSLLIPNTKNGHARTIPLTATALLMVTPSTADKPFPISANALRLSWQRLCRRAGISDLHFHDLRHEAISRFFEMGLTVPEVALISGHRDMRMLFRYSHATRAAIREKLR